MTTGGEGRGAAVACPDERGIFWCFLLISPTTFPVRWFSVSSLLVVFFGV
jgi:hypothetical protein